MSLLRKEKSPPDEDGRDQVVDIRASTSTTAAKVKPAPAPQQTKQEKAAMRSARAARMAEGRKVYGQMKPPEPMRAVLVGALVFAIAVVSYVSKDVNPAVKVGAKGYYLAPHPADALFVGLLALVAISTIALKKRVVTFVAFLVLGAMGESLPLSADASDLRWVAFLAPAGYALWIFMFRQRKDQTAWMADHPLPGGPARGAAGRAAAAQAQAQRQKGGTKAVKGRKAPAPPPLGPNGKPLPANSGRYTRPSSRPQARAAGAKPLAPTPPVKDANAKTPTKPGAGSKA